MHGNPVGPILRRLLACALAATALSGCKGGVGSGTATGSRPVAAAPALARPVVASAPPPASPATKIQSPATNAPRAAPEAAQPFPVMTGLDVLESNGFEILRGKRVGLLTHPAAVDRHGTNAIDVLRHAPGVRLVALFGGEHDVYGSHAAGIAFKDETDPRTGLMAFSLYNGIDLNHRPSRAQLKGIDAVVIDLQDIGTRSYTFVGAMKGALEGCFLAGVEVIVLDRPNPLGGLKVSGPLLDAQFVSYVGPFRVPYVHGLTMGEFARLAKSAPGVLGIPDAVRDKGRLTVVPMRGWKRSMRWPETGLHWVPTSPNMRDFSMVEGYPMTGLGCEIGGFSHGVGNLYTFRGISYKGMRADALVRELRALHVPGIDFHVINAPNAHTGQPAVGVYIEIVDWDAWAPTDLSFELMVLACKWSPHNPFAAVSKADAGRFQRYMGSAAFFNDLAAHGAKVDVAAYLREWKARDEIYQKESRKYWLYN